MNRRSNWHDYILLRAAIEAACKDGSTNLSSYFGLPNDRVREKLRLQGILLHRQQRLGRWRFSFLPNPPLGMSKWARRQKKRSDDKDELIEQLL